MKADIDYSLEIPEGVQVSVSGNQVTVKGPKGEVTKAFRSPKVAIAVKGNEVVFTAKQATQREKRLLLTARAHVRNMLQGAANGYAYQLKICSGHFPMNVSVSGEELVVKNFLGESVPRRLKLKHGAEVKLNGDMITVSSADIDLAGQQAADIEQLTRITKRDTRIFQDGIYITSKKEEMQ